MGIGVDVRLMSGDVGSEVSMAMVGRGKVKVKRSRVALYR